MKYDVDYFINKFMAIPEDRWCQGEFENDLGQCCTLGHCGMNGSEFTEEGWALSELVSEYYYKSGITYHPVTKINDGDGPNPKENILRVLTKIKEKQKNNE